MKQVISADEAAKMMLDLRSTTDHLQVVELLAATCSYRMERMKAASDLCLELDEWPTLKNSVLVGVLLILFL